MFFYSVSGIKFSVCSHVRFPLQMRVIKKLLDVENLKQHTRNVRSLSQHSLKETLAVSVVLAIQEGAVFICLLVRERDFIFSLQTSRFLSETECSDVRCWTRREIIFFIS